MTWTPVSSGTATRGLFTDLSVVLSKPAPAAVGHLAVALIHLEDDSPGTGINGPSGWTKIEDAFNTNSPPDSRHTLWYKVLDSGDVAGSGFTWGFPTASPYSGGALALFNSSNGSVTQGPEGAVNNTGNNSTSTVIPAVTTDTANALVVGTFDDWQEQNCTWPSPFTELVEVAGNGGGGLSIAYAVQAVAGSSGTVTVTHATSWPTGKLSSFNEGGGGGGPVQPPRSLHQFRMRRAA